MLNCARRAQKISSSTIFSETHLFQNKYIFGTFKIFLNIQFLKMRIVKKEKLCWVVQDEHSKSLPNQLPLSRILIKINTYLSISKNFLTYNFQKCKFRKKKLCWVVLGEHNESLPHQLYLRRILFKINTFLSFSKFV